MKGRSSELPHGLENRGRLMMERHSPILAGGSVTRTSVRSSMDRASDFGSEGWGFESLRARLSEEGN
jgi:hypothetical protein